MKLATLKNNTRDGQLVVVSQDLKQAITVTEIAPTLQYALDHWEVVSPHLLERYVALNGGNLQNAISFNQVDCESPLPRAYQWADGSAYVNHVELLRKARGAEMPDNFWTDPLMYQGGSDCFLGPHDDIVDMQEAWGIDFEAEIAVVTDDVPQGVSVDDAGNYIRLIMLVNDVSLRNLIPSELAKNFGFFQSKPSSAFSPVALTPDELSHAWDGKKVHLPLVSHLNGKLIGKPNAGVDMTFDFPTLIAHAAKTRALKAGTIVGSGTVSNKDRSSGSSCLAEIRMLEKINQGEVKTAFLCEGDAVCIEMLDADGNSLFGTIQQKVVLKQTTGING